LPDQGEELIQLACGIECERLSGQSGERQFGTDADRCEIDSHAGSRVMRDQLIVRRPTPESTLLQQRSRDEPFPANRYLYDRETRHLSQEVA
jgi:hypothetical protein